MGTKAETKKKPVADFPKFLMRIDGKQKFMPMQEAGVACSSLFCHIRVGSVLEADYSVRSITPAERDEMIAIADQCDADK